MNPTNPSCILPERKFVSHKNPPHEPPKMSNDTSAAWPQADQALSTEILDLVQQATYDHPKRKVVVS